MDEREIREQKMHDERIAATEAKDARIAALEAALAKAEEAVLKADNELAWATCMMAEGVEFYTLREVFHAAQKDAMKAHQTLKDALAAIAGVDITKLIAPRTGEEGEK